MVEINKLKNRLRTLGRIIEGSRRIAEHNFVNTGPTEEVAALLPHYHDSIATTYAGNGTCFHGSGRYTYPGYKYSQAPIEATPIDTLVRVMSEGIVPHRDPWLVESDEVTSTSLTEHHMYARWYAHKHQPLESPGPLWSYGDPDDWFAYFCVSTLLSELVHRPAQLGQIFRYYDRINGAYMAHKWKRSFNADPTIRSTVDTVFSRTNIAGNYGIIYGVPKSAVQNIMQHRGNQHEVRTQCTIRPEHISAIEVPLSQIGETQRVVDSFGLSARVLPVEVVDYYYSQQDLSQVM